MNYLETCYYYYYFKYYMKSPYMNKSDWKKWLFLGQTDKIAIS